MQKVLFYFMMSGGGGLPHLSVPRCIYFPIEDVSSRPTSEADKMTYTSVVSSGNCLGIAVSFLLRQSAIPSTHLHGFGHVQRSPPTTALQSVSRVSSMPERSSNRLKGRSFKVNVIAGLPKTNRCTIKDWIVDLRHAGTWLFAIHNSVKVGFNFGLVTVSYVQKTVWWIPSRLRSIRIVDTIAATRYRLRVSIFKNTIKVFPLSKAS